MLQIAAYGIAASRALADSDSRKSPTTTSGLTASMTVVVDVALQRCGIVDRTTLRERVTEALAGDRIDRMDSPRLRCKKIRVAWVADECDVVTLGVESARERQWTRHVCERDRLGENRDPPSRQRGLGRCRTVAVGASRFV